MSWPYFLVGGVVLVIVGSFLYSRSFKNDR
jgi:hypothetical protein